MSCEECKVFEMREGRLICAACGAPSKSKRWQTNTFGISAAAQLAEIEQRVAKMSKEQKTALMTDVIDEQGQIRYDAELSSERGIIAAERNIRRAREPWDLDVIRENAPVELKNAVDTILAKIAAQRHVADEIGQKVEAKHRECENISNMLDRNYFVRDRTTPDADQIRLEQLRGELQEYYKIYKEAKAEYEHGGPLYKEMVKNLGALDDWCLKEQRKVREQIAAEKRAREQGKKKTLLERLRDLTSRIEARA